MSAVIEIEIPSHVWVSLYEYLKDHEHEIARYENDFGELYEVFEVVTGEVPHLQDLTS